MADLAETQVRHVAAVVFGSVAGLVGDVTPTAMAKVGVRAVNSITVARCEIKDLGNNETEIGPIGEKTRLFWSRWVGNDDER